MLSSTISLNPSTAFTPGASNALDFAWVQPTAKDNGQVVRSVAAVKLTAPHILRIGHSSRKVNVLYTSTKVGVPVIIDRHFVSLSKVRLAPTMGLHDPDGLIVSQVGLWYEVPRIGADSPTAQNMMDEQSRLNALTNPSSNAGLIALMNGES
jgi:hypothetical protein